MFVTLMKSKIHRAVVTDSNLNYMGSITIDSRLMQLADILENEKVQIININNGQRFDTYAISGESENGTICINGAAARLVQPGDKIIIISYAMMNKEEARSFSPKVVLVDDTNHSTNISDAK